MHVDHFVVSITKQISLYICNIDSSIVRVISTDNLLCPDCSLMFSRRRGKRDGMLVIVTIVAATHRSVILKGPGP